MIGNGDGLKAVTTLRNCGIKTNLTDCMTLNQLFLGIVSESDYISLFFNRTKNWIGSKLKDDANKKEFTTSYALNVIDQAMNAIYDGGYETQLIIGSIRRNEDIDDIITASPHIITIPTKILKKMPFNEKNEETLKEFDESWGEFVKAEK